MRILPASERFQVIIKQLLWTVWYIDRFKRLAWNIWIFLRNLQVFGRRRSDENLFSDILYWFVNFADVFWIFCFIHFSYSLFYFSQNVCIRKFPLDFSEFFCIFFGIHFKNSEYDCLHLSNFFYFNRNFWFYWDYWINRVRYQDMIVK